MCVCVCVCVCQQVVLGDTHTTHILRVLLARDTHAHTHKVNSPVGTMVLVQYCCPVVTMVTVLLSCGDYGYSTVVLW